MKKLLFKTLFFAMTGFMAAACQNDIDGADISGQEIAKNGKKQLVVSADVSMIAEAETRALKTGTTFADGDIIGVTLVKNSDAGSYDGQDYNNIPYTLAVTSGPVYTWSTAADVLLSSTVGKVTAYYPYNSAAAYDDYTAIPVEAASKTDYMWGGWSGTVTNASPAATLTMNHALSAVRVNVVRGTYPGTGSMTALSVTSNRLATAATMNASTGALSSKTGKGGALSWTGTETLASGVSPAATTIDLTAVPETDASTAITFSVTLDGNSYTATANFLTGETPITVTAGNIYVFTLTVNGTDLEVSSVTVTDWTTNNVDLTGILAPVA